MAISFSVERTLVCLIFLLAITRIFFFNAAFPFFNNVDEQSHVDLIVKYSQGKLPNLHAVKMERESAHLFVRYGTPEYIKAPERNLLPFWKQLEGNPEIMHKVEKRIDAWEKAENYELFSPPLYYVFWAGWHNVGKILQVKEKYSLYWLRLLNIVVYAGIMLTAYQLIQLIKPKSQEFTLSCLLLLVVFPQDVFYSINNDVLSALVVPLAWLMLLKIGYEKISILNFLLTGLAISLTILTKLTNLPFLIIFIFTFIWIVKKWVQRSILKTNWHYLLGLILAAFLPVLLWCIYNYIFAGDFLAANHKIAHWGMRRKEFLEIFAHPIFHYEGQKIFLTSIWVSFWRGEFTWLSKHIATPQMDAVYLYSTVVFLFSGVFFCLAQPKKENLGFLILALSAMSIFSYLAFFGMISTLYDFGSGFYPSKDFPYFASGRLLTGILVPFVLFYCYGLQNLLQLVRLERYMPLFVLAFSIAIMWNEIVLSMPAIKSNFNFFAMLRL